MAALLDRLRAALSGRYRVERELGRGGMATVFLAEDLRHRRPVAVKVLDPELATAIGPERFLREIEIAAGFSHPHILTLHDSGESAGLLYYVMPFVEGESLRDRLRREKQLPVALALHIGTEVADAMAHAHARGVVHRDIKPENILLAGGHALVADFGIARALEAPGTRLTSTGVTLGTPAYISPEQAGGTPADARSDLYSLGCVLYEMLAGEPPFTGPTAESVAHQHLAVPAPPVTNLRPAVPAAVAEIVARLLAKAPTDRFASAEALREALQRGAAAVPTVLGPVPRAARPAPRAAALALGAAALLLALAGWWLWEHRPAGARRMDSLAVLPFENLSRDPAQEYLADGMTDELITTLAQIGALRVISRTSVMRFKRERRSAPQIGRSLGVDALVAGSVLRVERRIRVSVQLIRAATDQHLWAASYERDFGDVLALQNEVAGAIAREIRVRLTPRERGRLAATPAVHPEAHEEYLRGLHRLSQRTEPGFWEAIRHFERAIDVDPRHGPAWAGLADTYALLGEYAFLAPEESYPKARMAASRALEIDSTSSEAHASRGLVRTGYDRDWAGAERDYRRAIELNPSNASAHQWYAELLLYTGRYREAAKEIERALTLDPLSLIIHAMAGRIFFEAGQRQRGIRQALRALDLDSTFTPAHRRLGVMYLAMELPAQAVAELRRGLPASGTRLRQLSLLAAALAAAGNRSEAMVILDTLLAQPRGSAINAYGLAMVYAHLGDLDRAFGWLDSAYAAHDPNLADIRGDAAMAVLRSDPRYRELLRRMQLPQP